METEKIISLAKQIAKPAYTAMWLLAGLLILSVAGNVYMSSRHHEVVVEQENIESNYNNNSYAG